MKPVSDKGQTHQLELFALDRAAEISRLHGEIGEYLKTSLQKAFRIGELLTEQKAGLSHGDWGPWIKANLPFTDRTARNYMTLYDQRDRLKTENVSDLAQAYRLIRQPRQLPAGNTQPVPATCPDDLLRQYTEAKTADLQQRCAALDRASPSAEAIRECLCIIHEADTLLFDTALPLQAHVGKCLLEMAGQVPDSDLPGWLPRVGEIVVGRGKRGPNNAILLLVQPNEIAGFVRVYCEETYGREEESGILEGIRRGIRVDQVPRVFKDWHVFPETFDWGVRVPCGDCTDPYYDLLEPEWQKELKARAKP